MCLLWVFFSLLSANPYQHAIGRGKGWTRFQIVLVSWARERADLTHPPNPLPSPLTEREGGAAVRRQG